MDERTWAVVCVSGGMDSAVTAAFASRQHRLAFLHASYGQRTERRELACFHSLADHYGAERRLVVDLKDLRQIGGSSLTDPSGYPDCRPGFFRAFEEAIRLGTRPETAITIVTPVIAMSKAEIVRRGRDLGVPFEKTWSCYQAEERACGLCESCRLRLRGFREAGMDDPLPYRPPTPA
jgi:7-cyano-7-deazaguanine synthase